MNHDCASNERRDLVANIPRIVIHAGHMCFDKREEFFAGWSKASNAIRDYYISNFLLPDIKKKKICREFTGQVNSYNHFKNFLTKPASS